MNAGLLPLKANYTIVGGVTSYPDFASAVPEFVANDDIVVPSWVGGVFIRNLGGTAGN